jgi:hypothetical protein
MGFVESFKNEKGLLGKERSCLGNGRPVLFDLTHLQRAVDSGPLTVAVPGGRHSGPRKPPGTGADLRGVGEPHGFLHQAMPWHRKTTRWMPARANEE